MNFWFNFLKALRATETTPQMFGPLHIVALVILLGLCIGLHFLNRKINKKGYKITLLCCWITIVVLEIFKQICGMYVIVGNVIQFRYWWTFFPFHLCSAPLYILPFVIFMKDTNWFKAKAEIFSAVIFMFGGIIGAFIPSFCELKYINFQTLIYHSIMIFSSLLIALQCRKQFRFNNLVLSLPLYFAMLITALILNAVILNNVPIAKTHGMNLWFITWHYAPSVPLIDIIWKAVPYPVYLLLYILGSMLLMFIFYVIYSACLNRRVDFNIHSEKWLALHAKDKTKIVSAKNQK